jgi:type I restriction enzyme, S subunit
MGAMGVSPKDGIVSPAYNVYSPTDELWPDFLNLLVRIPQFKEEVTRYSKGVWSSRLRLYPEGLYEVYFPLPPIEEQKAIVNFLQSKLDNIGKLEKATNNTISLLQERRSALITAAVTGKLEEAYL